MAYMKKNVNFGFFLLLAASIICLVGVSIYYQTTFKDLYLDYKEKIDALNEISSTLTSERDRLNQTSYQLMVKEEREEELSSQYSDIKQEKDKIQADKVKIQQQLQSTRAELYLAQTNLATAQAELASTKNELNSAKTTISSLNRKISDLEEDVELLEVQLAAYQN